MKRPSLQCGSFNPLLHTENRQVQTVRAPTEQGALPGQETFERLGIIRVWPRSDFGAEPVKSEYNRRSPSPDRIAGGELADPTEHLNSLLVKGEKE